ncbi:hypothetical protein [Parabacteroides sp. FAFU027]|uniref:hypothetical protein n=1 Tax=Parabacteroides sp. FAFU027 TaxID=2922715 RepID=UPI001FAEAAD3|nr:hypothetical protein [Parabacteroides sp. FAFU027]
MNRNKITKIFWRILAVMILMNVIYVYGYRILNDYFVDNSADLIKAVIIDEENIIPNSHGVHPEYTYSYQFEINGKKYTGNSHDKSLAIGDTINVRFFKPCPYFNKPLNPTD